MSGKYLTRGSEALDRMNTVSLPLERILERGRFDRAESLPLERPEKAPAPRRRKRKGPSTRRDYERIAENTFAPSINLFGFAVLFFLCFFFLYSCIEYLRIKDKIITVNMETKKIMANAERMRYENDNKENKLYSKVNFDEIRERALTELGMVYPYKNHVIAYEAVSSGYVRQYGELKGSDGFNLFEKILSMFAAR